MATPYGFPGQYDGLGQHQTYGYPPSPMYNDGPSWGAGPDELAGGPLGYGRGNYAPSGAPHHGFNALERYSLAEQQLLLMQAQRMQGLGAGFPDAMHLRRGSPRPMRPLPGFSDYDIPGAGYYPMESPLKLEVVDTLHVSTPHDRSLDRADLCDVFFPMPQMKKLSFHENYVFVLFDSVAAARNAMLQLQQGQAGPKAAQLTVTFARQSYRDNYYHPDEVYMPSKRLHLTHVGYMGRRALTAFAANAEYPPI